MPIAIRQPRAEALLPTIDYTNSVPTGPREAVSLNGRAAVDTKEAAKLLGLAPKTLVNWRNLGIGPKYIKYGGRLGPVRYGVADLLAWRDAHWRGGPAGSTDGGSHGQS